VAAWSKAWVGGRSLAGIAGSNPAMGMGVCRECCVFSRRGYATSRSLVQRSPTECGVHMGVITVPRRGGLGPLGLSSHGGKKLYYIIQVVNVQSMNGDPL